MVRHEPILAQLFTHILRLKAAPEVIALRPSRFQHHLISG
jgi:hypothetical protein